MDREWLIAWEKTKKKLKRILPRVFIVILIVSLIKFLVPPTFYRKLFTGNPLLDTFIGTVAGSFAMGNPTTGYIIVNPLIGKVFVGAIVSFLIAWVTVGIAQFPIEEETLGRKFAIARNLVAFVLAFIGGIIAGLIL